MSKTKSTLAYTTDFAGDAFSIPILTTNLNLASLLKENFV